MAGNIFMKLFFVFVFIFCVGLNLQNCYVIIDHTVEKSNNLVTGANEDGFHYKNFNAQRDFLSTLTQFARVFSEMVKGKHSVI